MPIPIFINEALSLSQKQRKRKHKLLMHMSTQSGQRTYQNDPACTIFTLPMEVLTLIFEKLAPPSIGINDVFCADAENNLQHAQNIKYVSKQCIHPCTTAHTDLIRLSQVCYHWRTILLNHPLFWRPIWITNHKHSSHRALQLMQRAHNIPLEVIVIESTRHVPVKGYTGSHADIFPESKQRYDDVSSFCPGSENPMLAFWKIYSSVGKFIKILHISSPIPRVADGFFKEPMPFLESVALDNLHRPGQELYWLPKPLFSAVIPKLKRLLLKSVRFSWHDHCFTNLTFIHISLQDNLESDQWITGSTNTGNSLLSLNRLLQILSNCPELVTLDLHGVRLFGDILTILPVLLPNLQHLNLNGIFNPEQCLSILSCIETPILQTLKISHPFNTPHSFDKDDLPPERCFNLFSASAMQVNYRISCQWCSLPDLNFTVANKLGNSCLVAPPSDYSDALDKICKFKYSVTECNEYHESAFKLFFLSFLDQFCSPSTKSLTLYTTFFTNFPFNEFFAHFVDLEELCLSACLGGRSQPFFQFLQGITENANHSDQNILALPSLRIIVFYKIDFANDMEKVLDFLDLRKLQGHPLDEVKAVQCINTPPVYFDAMRQFVQHVNVI